MKKKPGARGGGGGDDTPLYRLHRYLRHQRVWLFSPFGLKRYQFRPVWPGDVFLEEDTSSSLGDKTISLWVLCEPSKRLNSTVLYPS